MRPWPPRSPSSGPGYTAATTAARYTTATEPPPQSPRPPGRSAGYMKQRSQHNAGYDSPGLSADQFATMARHTPGSPGPAVATVAHASLLRHTDAAHDHVQAVTEDRATNALTVVSAAEKAYREVGEHARRLSGTAVSRVSAALNPTHPGFYRHDHPTPTPARPLPRPKLLALTPPFRV